MNMTLSDKLYDIRVVKKSPAAVYKESLSLRLGMQTKNYKETIERNCKYILSRSNQVALRCIERYNKRKEKHDYDEEHKIGFINAL